MDVRLRLARPAAAVIKQDQRDVLSDRRPPRRSCSQLRSRDWKLESPGEPSQSFTIEAIAQLGVIALNPDQALEAYLRASAVQLLDRLREPADPAQGVAVTHLHWTYDFVCH
jgi:hypothetical protein